MASFLDTLFGGGAEADAANKNRALYDQYGKLGTDFLNSGMTGSKDALATAKGEFLPLSQIYSKGANLYGDALGINGPTGTANAETAFTSSPGYRWQVDQGMDAINRRRAAGGMLNSGNADIDALTFGQGAAKQDYQAWLDRLNGVNHDAITTAGAMSGIDTRLSDLYGTDATNRISLEGNVTSGGANANVLQAQGEATGAKNLLGGVLGGASLLASGGLSSLANKFKPLGGAFNFGS
jgi:hypothetical protein